MNRRQALKGVLTVSVGAWAFQPRPIGAQDGKTPATQTGAIYVNSGKGADSNSGAKEGPLRTLAAAARRVNESAGTGAATVILAEGVYAVDEPALFKPAKRSFTKDARLTIRAEVLPDDPAWSPQRMPVLIHTMALSPNWMGRTDPFGGVNYGMQFETSHVTVQGLKVLGTPHLERPTPRSIRRVYPIAREDGDLDDLEIKQCLFVGNREVAENHCAILARGHGVVVDHCVFYGCKIAMVYWTGKARGCAMRNTLAVGNYVTGAWLCGVGEDFEFSGNVMSANKSAVLFQGPVGKYDLAKSLFAGNENLYGSGFGPPVNFKPLQPSVLALPPSSSVAAKPVEVDLDQSKRNYLHVVAGTPGSELGAGLFTA
jgi:hypothetical protein